MQASGAVGLKCEHLCVPPLLACTAQQRPAMASCGVLCQPLASRPLPLAAYHCRNVGINHSAEPVTISGASSPPSSCRHGPALRCPLIQCSLPSAGAGAGLAGCPAEAVEGSAGDYAAALASSGSVWGRHQIQGLQPLAPLSAASGNLWWLMPLGQGRVSDPRRQLAGLSGFSALFQGAPPLLRLAVAGPPTQPCDRTSKITPLAPWKGKSPRPIGLAITLTCARFVGG